MLVRIDDKLKLKAYDGAAKVALRLEADEIRLVTRYLR